MKKSVAVCLLVLLVALLFTGCEENTTQAETHPVYPVYEKYTEIPGVTQEEITAIESLKEQYGGFSVAMNYSNEAFYQSDGAVGGYNSLFCAWLSDLFGISFETEILEWDALIEGLASHRVDFTGELTATEERRETYFMTDAIAERTIKSFRLENSAPLSELAASRDLRYAFLEGATASAYVGEAAETPFTTTYVTDHAQAVELLRAGEIDAFFEDGTAEAAFDSYKDIVAEDFFPLIYTPVSLSTANPALAPIIDVVQKYLDHGAIYHLTELYNQGEQEYQKHKLYSQLSEEERGYLREHAGGQGIPVAAEFDNYPASFYNTTEQQWQGIAHDVLDEISTLTGLSFVIANEPDVLWSDLLRMLESGEVALITELIPSKERQGLFIWPESPYSVDNFALISLAEQENIKVNQIWYSSVALAGDTAYEEAFDKWFPNHQHTRHFASTDDCYAALEEGSVDFVMASRNSMLSMTNYSEKPGFKVNILFSNTYESSFGLHKDQEILCSIIGKAQKLVDTESITDHWVHRVFDYRAKMTRTQIPYLLGLAALLVLVLVLLFILLLRHRKSGKELEQLVRRRTAELEVQTEAAKQASRAKSDFLSRMSHEIRTPLNAIIGMAQVGRQVPDVPPKAQAATEEIITASHHLLGVLNDILDMAKIESGKFALANAPFALLPAMEEVAGIIRQRCEEKGLAFETHFESLQDVVTDGDKLRLKQVLINLLGNAVKFTGSGGRIDFAVENVENTEETRDAVTLCFSVKDNGIGMTEEQRAHLFVAFEQADDTIAVQYGGTGLGLAISQNMVQKMGGEIQVESQIGQGSRFWFTLSLPSLPNLPNLARAELLEEEGQKTAALDLRGRRILLAEDVDVNRLVLIELLGDTGVEIEEAEDGQAALERFQNAEPGYYDLVLMDIQMPRMNGYETTRAIRALPREDAKTVPIIAMTANAYDEDVDRALESGMNGHIAKPLDMQVVQETLKQFL